MDDSENEEEERGITKNNSEGMNTKEMINLLLNLEALYKHSDKPNYARIMNNCIKAIERSEKYEKVIDELIDMGKNTWGMWEEFRAYIRGKSNALTNKMFLLEQKYFPKEK